jgi:hypothetical protein
MDNIWGNVLRFGPVVVFGIISIFLTIWARRRSVIKDRQETAERICNGGNLENAHDYVIERGFALLRGINMSTSLIKYLLEQTRPMEKFRLYKSGQRFFEEDTGNSETPLPRMKPKYFSYHQLFIRMHFSIYVACCFIGFLPYVFLPWTINLAAKYGTTVTTLAAVAWFIVFAGFAFSYLEDAFRLKNARKLVDSLSTSSSI